MNISKDDFLNLINLSIDDVNLLLEDGLKLKKVEANSSGAFDSLDSLGVVNFLYAIENNFQKLHDININLLNESFYDDPLVHLSSINNFITFIESCFDGE